MSRSESETMPSLKGTLPCLPSDTPSSRLLSAVIRTVSHPFPYCFFQSSVMMSSFFGGASASYAPSSSQQAWFKDFTLGVIA
jgi:hypothetical protein